jgi:hypothetical protein
MEVFGMGQKVLVATHNKGKIAEFKEMMRDLALDWIGLADIGVTSDVAETGTTFEENAILKAKAYAAESGLLTLADDSGLEVDALDGQPGVYTARYGGQALTSKETRPRPLSLPAFRAKQPAGRISRRSMGGCRSRPVCNLRSVSRAKDLRSTRACAAASKRSAIFFRPARPRRSSW